MITTSASSTCTTNKQAHETGHDLDEQGSRKWQEEISTGFDRLMAYATEVDKRRKSCDSNSPGFNNESSPTHCNPNHASSPINATTPENNRQPSDMLNCSREANEESSDHFDNRMSTLSMKFKRAPSYHRYPGPPLRSPTSSISSGSRHFAASSIPRDHDLISPPPTMESNSATRASLIASSREPIPGENLPEHHFKKRYFAERIEHPKGGGLDTSFPESSILSSPLSPKKRLSILGTKCSELGRSTSERTLLNEREQTPSPSSSTKKDVVRKEIKK